MMRIKTMHDRNGSCLCSLPHTHTNTAQTAEHCSPQHGETKGKYIMIIIMRRSTQWNEMPKRHGGGSSSRPQMLHNIRMTSLCFLLHSLPKPQNIWILEARERCWHPSPCSIVYGNVTKKNSIPAATRFDIDDYANKKKLHIAVYSIQFFTAKMKHLRFTYKLYWQMTAIIII